MINLLLPTWVREEMKSILRQFEEPIFGGGVITFMSLDVFGLFIISNCFI